MPFSLRTFRFIHIKCFNRYSKDVYEGSTEMDVIHFLITALEHYGFGNDFIECIKILL